MDNPLLEHAINVLMQNYQPCAQEQAETDVTTLNIYELVQEICPGDYTTENVANMLHNYGWEVYYHPLLQKVLWKVRKTI